MVKAPKKNVYILAAVILIGIITVLGGRIINTSSKDKTDVKASNFEVITPKEAKKRMDSEKGIIVLDVRTQEEYNAGHIKDSILIPVDVLEKESGKKLTDKNAPIFVYCRSGNRSTTAADILVKQGYKKVYNLGGIINWPYEIVK